MSSRLRLGVLVSGSGSNLQALLDACAGSDFPARVVLVVSNVASAHALERAERAGVTTRVLEHQRFATREAFDEALAAALQEAWVEIVCLAGFMRLLGARFLASFEGRVLNIHPSLLPAFPGLHAPRQALARGVRITGCTVHFVDGGVDAGPILAQAAVPVLDGDDEGRLAARILVEEHRLYPLAIRLLATGAAGLEQGRTWLAAPPHASGTSLRHPGAGE